MNAPPLPSPSLYTTYDVMLHYVRELIFCLMPFSQPTENTYVKHALQCGYTLPTTITTEHTGYELTMEIFVMSVYYTFLSVHGSVYAFYQSTYSVHSTQ